MISVPAQFSIPMLTRLLIYKTIKLHYTTFFYKRKEWYMYSLHTMKKNFTSMFIRRLVLPVKSTVFSATFIIRCLVLPA